MDTPAEAKISTKIAIWIPVAAALLALGLGFVLSEVQVKIGWVPLLVAVGSCLGIFYLAFVLYTRESLPASVALIKDIKAHVEHYAPDAFLKWTLSARELCEYEVHTTADEVWLISFDLSDDIPTAPFYDVVRRNLRRGITYKYFIPNAPQSEARMASLRENLKGLGHVQFSILSDEFFLLTQYLDFTIYDPMNRRGVRSAYLGVATPDCGRMHIKLTPDIADVIIGRIQHHVHSTH